MASEEPEWKKTAIPLDVHLAIVGHLVASLPEGDRARVFDEAMGLVNRMVLDGALGRRYTPNEAANFLGPVP